MKPREKIKTLVELLQYRAVNEANNAGYTFLPTGEVGEEEKLGYRDLDLRARAVAASIQHVLKPGDRALLVYPSGLDYIVAFFGCLYAGVVAVPVYPPRKNNNADRLKKVIVDAGAAAVLSTTKIMPQMREHLSTTLDVNSLHWISTDLQSIEVSAADEWRDPGVIRDTQAFLQYTSGSTGNPKGVILTHDNLLHNQWMTVNAFDCDSSSNLLGWLPLYHDMGLIGNVMQPLYLGSSCVLMPPIAFLQRPVRWLKAISHYRPTVSGGPNFAYDLCVARIPLEQCVDLDLSSWTLAFNGSEPVRKHTLEQFSRTFSDYGFRPESFYPCYGLAEGSLFVTGGLKGELPRASWFRKNDLMQNKAVQGMPEHPDSQALVSSGRSWGDQELVIVKPETKQVQFDGYVGEIWVKSPSITQGYWKDVDQTREKCQAHLVDSNEGDYLRTGDLGFMENGELFITGRLKDLIIIRGQNYYPQDLERTAELSHSALRENASAAFSIDENGGSEKLVLIVEVDRMYARDINIQDVNSAIRHAISNGHQVQVHTIILIRHGSILKTSSGKIQHKAMKIAFSESRLEVVGAWSLDWVSIETHLPTMSCEFVDESVQIKKVGGEVSAKDSITA
jgi:acyl-CoA synthetase (AMP-forming)/AMP-acid ligase II